MIVLGLLVLAAFTAGSGGDPVVLPGSGLRVLIVYESSQPPEAKLLNVMHGKALDEWCQSHCTKPAADGPADFRVYDKDTNLAGEPEHWTKAMALAKEPWPCLVVSDGKRGYVGPLPDDAAAAIKICERFSR